MVELRIKEVMKSKGINTQKELAEKMGVSAANLSAMLKRIPSLETLDKISIALEVEITELFAKTNDDRVGEELVTTDFICPNCKEVLCVIKK